MASGVESARLDQTDQLRRDLFCRKRLKPVDFRLELCLGRLAVLPATEHGRHLLPQLGQGRQLCIRRPVARATMQLSHSSRNGARMSDQLSEDVPSSIAQAWDSARRVREPVAWTLLVLTAFIVVVSACQLFNLAGAKIPVVSQPVPVSSSAVVPAGSGPAPGPVGPSPVHVSAFALRASAVAPQFFGAFVIALPVLAIVLVAFSGGLTKRARQVIQTVAVVQAVALLLGVISVASAAGTDTRPGTWFVLVAAELAIAATALIFTGAVLHSRALWSLAPGFEDLGEDEEDLDDEADSDEHD
jgi:hypothetical protein